jgi:hypothetical protein
MRRPGGAWGTSIETTLRLVVRPPLYTSALLGRENPGAEVAHHGAGTEVLWFSVRFV